MTSKLKNKEKGFTIIEVLIVLVIAGLIMLIVFLAVPALQRNSRNNARKSDASRIANAVTETINNNNGRAPSPFTTATISANLGTLGFYTVPTTAVTFASASTGASVTNPDAFPTVGLNATCNTNGDGTAVAAANSRSFVVLYAVETGGGGNDPECITS